jgi:ribosomal protein S18 acetylase RimI-like enzyme
MDGSGSGYGQPRLAVSDDLPAIGKLIRAAYSRYADRMDRLPAPVLHDYRSEVGAGQTWVIGDPIAGVIVLIPEDQDSLLIENVAVVPSAQGAGLGRALMEFAQQQASMHGLHRLRLYTNEVMTENIAFYSKLGYYEVGRSTHEGYRRVFMEKAIGE